MADAAEQNRQLADQITELRARVVRLQAAVEQTGPGKTVNRRSGMKMGTASSKGMGMMDDKSEMGMSDGKGAMPSDSAAPGMKDDQGEMGGMSPAGNGPMSPGMSMGDKKDGMSGMPMGGKSKTSPGGNAAMSAMPAAGGTAAMSGPSSATPDQSGASHLYHMGSNGFFLNHSRHITLTPDQKLALNYVKGKAMLDQTSGQRKIDRGEQELYTLTGAYQPDIARVQAKIVEIEKLRADQRMNFIRAVAEASDVLTPGQRKTLLGTTAATEK
jgi:Spy/CpxP family protein refolding chaperone